MSKQYAFHPLADIFPLMQGEEFDALVADINANGLRERIDKYRGKIVDGRNRYRALLQLGIDPSADEKKYFRNVIYRHPMGGGFAPCDDASVLAYVVSKNIHRRHLTADQKRDLIAKLIKAEPTKSNRQIGKQVVASHPHVAKVRAEMEKTSDVETVTTSVDTKGRKQPAKRPRANKVESETPCNHDQARASDDGTEWICATCDVHIAKSCGCKGVTAHAVTADAEAAAEAMKAHFAAADIEQISDGDLEREMQRILKPGSPNPICTAWDRATEFDRVDFARRHYRDVALAALDALEMQVAPLIPRPN
jgi:hypothetical protein